MNSLKLRWFKSNRVSLVNNPIPYPNPSLQVHQIIMKKSEMETTANIHGRLWQATMESPPPERSFMVRGAWMCKLYCRLAFCTLHLLVCWWLSLLWHRVIEQPHGSMNFVRFLWKLDTERRRRKESALRQTAAFFCHVILCVTVAKSQPTPCVAFSAHARY